MRSIFPSQRPRFSIPNIRRLTLCRLGLNPYREGKQSSPRIEVLLRGGLGNQLFGYSAGLDVANRLGVPLHLVVPAVYRGVEPARPFELAEVVGDSVSWGRQSLAEKYFVESSFRFDPSIKCVNEGTMLDGYFQSSRYFVESAPNVQRRINLSPSFKRGQESIQDRPFIALHVRRGDYLAVANQKFHGLIPESFFEDGLNLLRERTGPLTALVFSDDAVTAERLSGRLERARPFEADRAQSSLEVLGALSSAEALCISNSTFGWWGAYLAGVERAVIFPDPWFVDASLDSRDLPETAWRPLAFSEQKLLEKKSSPGP